MARFIDLTGQRFGRLTVTSRVNNTKMGHTCWNCECDCGKQKIISGNSLRRGLTKSCGCLHDEGPKLKHGHSQRIGYSRTYRVWDHMLQRCNNKNTKQYEDYGGRGIKVCDRWDTSKGGSFKNFLDDMGECPGRGYSIDKVDNNNDYYPKNCRWATNREQNRNMRSNRNYTFNNKTQCRTDWAKEYKICPSTLQARLDTLGWSIEKALTTPVRKRE